MAGKQVVIAGSAGFLGSHLAEKHLKEGDTVLGIDDFSSSNPRSRHHKALKAYEGYTFVERNICTIIGKDWNKIGAKHASIVYNAACPASPPVYQQKPIHTMMTCVQGTKNLLDLAQATKAVFVQFSTSEVYGDPDCAFQKETYRGSVNCYGPRSNYDEGKRAGEALCYDYRNSIGVDARVVRIFNCYGIHMDLDDGRVVTNFVKQALSNQKLTIYGNGNQTRSFCYVDDLVNGIYMMAHLDKNPDGPINIGNTNEFTMLDLARMIIRKVYAIDGSFSLEPYIERRPMPTDDPRQRCPDIERAKVILGWEPTTPLSVGLDRVIAYAREDL